MADAAPQEADAFPCGQCGAELEWSTEKNALACGHCGYVQAEEHQSVDDHDLASALTRLQAEHQEGTLRTQVEEIRCGACGATTDFDDTLIGTGCAFCGQPLVKDEALHAKETPLPLDGVVPASVSQSEAFSAIGTWVRSRWFAPRAFLERGGRQEPTGVYLPFFTFDAEAHASYTGARGENYTVTVGSGKNRRTVTRTRWWPVQGEVTHRFDDLAVPALSEHLGSLVDGLAPWPTQEARPFDNRYLAGFVARRQDMSLLDGFREGRNRMLDALRRLIREDIGGDHQAIHTLDASYGDEGYKLVLAPCWLSSTTYKNKTYRVAVNGVTAKVMGERPWSIPKVTSAVLAALALGSGAAWLLFGN